MIDAVTKFCEAAEDITDELTDAAGSIVTKATPLLAPLASGATVLFACYDGIGRMIDGMIKYPYTVSFVVGFVLSMAIEGVNFASQHARDRAERLKATQGQALDYVNAGSLVTQSFLLTLAVILFLESVPGLVAWWNNELGTSDMTFRFGLLVLPFFSRIGARIFSVSTILDAIEGTQQSRRAKRLQAKREALKFDLEMETMRKKAELDVAQMEAATQRKIERGSFRPVQNRDTKLQQDSVENPKSQTIENSTPTSGEDVEFNSKKAKIQQRRNMIFQHIKINGDPGPSAFAEQFNVDRGTIYSDLKALAGDGAIYKNGDGGYHAKI